MPSTDYPSIYNDVIGPVMRGPSSSHCAAAVRIGRLARDLVDGDLREVRIAYDAHGSLATTHASQGSDMGLYAGLLGWDATDERLPDSARAIREAGIHVEIEIASYRAEHPNTYRLTLANAVERHEMTAISVGGGMIEVVEIDGVLLSIRGDYCETLLYLDGEGDDAHRYLADHAQADEICLHRGAAWGDLVEVKAQGPLAEAVRAELRSTYGVRRIKTLFPVLPVLSRTEVTVPFLTCDELLAYNAQRGLDLWELAVRYERARGNLSHAEVHGRMVDLVHLMRASIQRGLAGTEYEDRILGYQSGSYAARMADGRLLDAGILNQIVLYVTAMMEVKSAMGVIVAAPTAGACGVLPGACCGAAEAMGLSVDEMAKALLAAGVIGVLIAARATFAAEVGGCQAECGSGSGMAAAALVTLAGGTTQQAVDAASMALQNVLGMTCDPVANRVEVPCLGKNVLAASNALACANMALAGYDPVLPLDEVIETVDRVGKSLPRELRCTALGGLSITETSKAIEARLSGSENREQEEELHHKGTEGTEV
jgi:L-serine dehydratase